MLHQDGDWIKARYDEGLSQREIAKLAGVSAPTIRAAFKRFGIKARSISDALKLKPSRHDWTDEERELHSQKMREVVASQKEAKSLRMKERWANDRESLLQAIKIAITPERVLAASKRSLALWSEPKYRDLVINNLRQATSDPGHRQRLSAATAKAFKDPEKRARLLSKFSDDDYMRKLCEHLQHANKLAVAKLKVLREDPDFVKAAKARSRKLWEDDEFRKKVVAKLAEQPRISSLAIKLYDYLDDLNVRYVKEGPETVIGYYQFDCLVPKTEKHKNILIECQGDHWYGLPQTQIRDRQKFTYINRYFPDYEIMYLWEHEFSQRDGVLDRLKLKLGISIDTVDFEFKDLILKEPDAGEVTEFLSKYHYIGKPRGGKKFGAYLGNKLVAVAVFSPPVRQSIDGVEISRFCIHPQYHKKNCASYLLSRWVKQFKGTKIVAFSDSTVGHTGSIYKAVGFRLEKTVEPDYWYVSSDGFVMHKKTLYNRAASLSMSESDFAEAKNYSKVYGGPKHKFVLQR